MFIFHQSCKSCTHFYSNRRLLSCFLSESLLDTRKL